MCMKIKIERGIPVNDFFAEIISLFGIQDSQGIGEHESFNFLIFQGIKYIINIFL